MNEKIKTVLILHNIRSRHNVGSIFRTADAAGIGKIYLTGYTPTPTDRFGRPDKQIIKVALGAQSNIEWEKNLIQDVIDKLRSEGFKIVALEQGKSSTDYKNLKLKEPLALILGNEVGGIDSRTLKRTDHIVQIPMKGEKESLNVSVAAGIAIFRILNI